MSLKLPATGHKARELFDVAQLVELTATPEGRAKLQAFREAVAMARKYMALDTACRSMNLICLRADGQLWLVRVTPRTWAKVWNFGAL